MFSLLSKNLRREFRQREVKLLFLMVSLSAFILSATNEVNVLVKNKVRQESAVILGADLILTSSYPLESKFIQEAKRQKLISSQKIDFFTMAVANDELLLASVNAVSTPFPLTSSLSIKNQHGQIKRGHHAPRRGEVWVEHALLKRLKLSLGGALFLGNKSFRVSGLINSELNQSGNFINFSPKVLINIDDLAETKVLQRGSRASYQLLLKGPTAQLNDFSEFFNEHKNTHQSLISPRESNLTRSVYNNILNFINIGMMFSVMLAAMACLLACQRYAAHQFKKVALMRVFGHPSQKITVLSLTTIRVISLFAIFLGVLISIALKPLLCRILSVEYQLEGLLSSGSFFFAMISNVLMLMIFLFASFIKLKHVSAIDLFQKKAPVDSLAASLLYCLSGLVLFGAVYYLTHHLKLSLIFFYLVLSFYLISWVVLYLLNKGALWLYIGRPLIKSYYLKRLYRNFSVNVLQVFAITSALSIAFTLWLLQDALFKHWQTMIVKDVPNVFLINLEHTQVAKLEEYLSQKKISHSPIYPMVRGRLIKINGIAVGELFKDKAKPRSLLRELNLSTSKQLAKNNKVIRGAFTTHSVKGQNTVSVEAGMAKRVGIGLNDELSFSVSGEELKAVVTSIRTVEWTSFNPNFFMIFNPQALKDYPKTYITSFHVKERRERVMTELIKKFPNASIIDLTGIISSIQILVDAIKQALLFIVGFALLAAVVVILLLYLSFSNERHKDARIFTLFGLNAKHIRRMQWREPAFIGLSSGIAVSVCSYFSNFLLIEGILNIQFEPQLTIVLLPIVLSVFLMSLLYRFLP